MQGVSQYCASPHKGDFDTGQLSSRLTGEHDLMRSDASIVRKHRGWVGKLPADIDPIAWQCRAVGQKYMPRSQRLKPAVKRGG